MVTSTQRGDTEHAPPRAAETQQKPDAPESSELPPATGNLVDSTGAKLAWLVGLVILLAFTILCSLAFGSRHIDFSVAWSSIVDPSLNSEEVQVIRQLRIPRTVLGVLAGIALGVAGALIQALTRNPLADPGILGVNAGAQFALVTASFFLGSLSVIASIWWALAGALVATLAVYGLSLSRNGRSAEPATLVLAGVAFGAVLSGVTTALVLIRPQIFDMMRVYAAGNINGHELSTVLVIVPFVAVGLLISLCCAGSLNAIALGDAPAKALGVRIAPVRIAVITSVTLLCGAATALAGPIGFVGLMIPHVVRWLFGVQQGWILVFTMVLAPVLLLGSDILGRIILPNTEVSAGIVTAFLGAPVLLILARRKKASTL
ncbi:iron chelate uptake ABC transporter family permease subunit [Glutamicibacter ectropisis]|uniref:Iron chelate uptake ABC transporter family permease subunit n=1 Tax=Glutamicibacter ectropisis TaxID=3046593 RepID=A0AAU6WGZ3_9MICC